jgi:D-alanyl-D-alanine dipeptidase
MKNKELILIFLFFFQLLSLQLIAQHPIYVTDKNDKLYVIKDIKTYKNSIESDSEKQMVMLKDYAQSLITDFKYATENNFTHHVLYHHPIAFARLPVAKALQKVQAELKTKGLSLKFYDAYRPYHVTEEMWKIVPDDRYAANPAKGSGHNRGIAVDISLIDLSTMKELPMPTPFDDFTEKAHYDYMQLDNEVLQNRQLLKDVMEKYGFIALATEWWHFYWPDPAKKFEVLDIPFQKLEKQ